MTRLMRLALKFQGQPTSIHEVLMTLLKPHFWDASHRRDTIHRSRRRSCASFLVAF